RTGDAHLRRAGAAAGRRGRLGEQALLWRARADRRQGLRQQVRGVRLRLGPGQAGALQAPRPRQGRRRLPRGQRLPLPRRQRRPRLLHRPGRLRVGGLRHGADTRRDHGRDGNEVTTADATTGTADPASTGTSAPAAPRDRAQRLRDTRAKLESETDLWVATADPSGGGPHLIPLSYHWDGATFLISTPRTSVTSRNLLADRRVRLSLGPTRDVVVVDATAEPADLADLGSPA